MNEEEVMEFGKMLLDIADSFGLLIILANTTST